MGKQVIFPLPAANVGNQIANQIAAFDSINAGVFGIEDILVRKNGSDRDYNDIVFWMTGSTAIIASADETIHTNPRWNVTTLAQAMATHVDTEFDQHIQGDILYNTLLGGVGDDLIEGFKGRDILNGGAGQNVLTGGSGEDVFVLGTDSQENIITAFRPNYDVIGCSDGLRFADLSLVGSDIILNQNAQN